MRKPEIRDLVARCTSTLSQIDLLRESIQKVSNVGAMKEKSEDEVTEAESLLYGAAAALDDAREEVVKLRAHAGLFYPKKLYRPGESSER